MLISKNDQDQQTRYHHLLKKKSQLNARKNTIGNQLDCLLFPNTLLLCIYFNGRASNSWRHKREPNCPSLSVLNDHPSGYILGYCFDTSSTFAEKGQDLERTESGKAFREHFTSICQLRAARKIGLCLSTFEMSVSVLGTFWSGIYSCRWQDKIFGGGNWETGSREYRNRLCVIIRNETLHVSAD